MPPHTSHGTKVGFHAAESQHWAFGGSKLRGCTLCCADALAYLATIPVLHRDIKPANILVNISDGRLTKARTVLRGPAVSLHVFVLTTLRIKLQVDLSCFEY